MLEWSEENLAQLRTWGASLALKPGRKVATFDADGTLWADDVAEDFFRWLIAEGKPINAAEVLQVVLNKQQLPPPTEVVLEAPDLSTFDSLLQHKDVYDDQESNPEKKLRRRASLRPRFRPVPRSSCRLRSTRRSFRTN